MTEYMTEQEQIEIIKNWIKQYSLVILAGMAIAIVGIMGWRYWEQRQNNIISHASSIYDEMLTMRAQNNAEGTRKQAKKLFSRYPDLTYAHIAALMLAREAVFKKDYVEAEKKLRFVIDESDVPALRQIARIRLARLMIINHAPEASLKLLKKVDDKSFDGMANEVRGDAYLALNDPVLARQAYQQALADLPNAEVIRPLLEMKFDNLSTTAPSAS